MRLPMLVAIMLSVGCKVDVPDPDDGKYPCDSEEDCADGYECRDNWCVREVVSDCRENDCHANEDCIRLLDGRTTCIKRCPDYDECSSNEACVEAQGIENDKELFLAVCRPCPRDCGPYGHCEVIHHNNDFYENIGVACRPHPVDCPNAECGLDLDYRCVQLVEGQTVTCAKRCGGTPYVPCDNSAACVEVSLGANPTLKTEVCVPCPEACSATAECQAFNPQYPYAAMTNVDAGCMLIGGGCTSDPLNVCPNDEDQECIYVVLEGETACLPQCEHYNECLPDEVCAEVQGDGTPYAACVPCPGGCPPGERCFYDGDPGDPKDLQGHLNAVSCRME